MIELIVLGVATGAVGYVIGYFNGSTFNVDNRSRVTKEIETEECEIRGGTGANGRGNVTIESMDADGIEHLTGAKGARASGTVSVTERGDDDGR